MKLSSAARREWMGARYSFAVAQLELRRLRLSLLLRRFNPSQPRVPAGNPDGGQWTSGGEGSNASDVTARTPVASQQEENRRQRIDLRMEEIRGGHTLREHVEKTDAELIGRLEREHWDLWIIEGGRKRVGTFHSIGEANEYVGRTLEANQSIVDEVASGKRSDAFLTYRFGFMTGREAIVDPRERAIILRKTYGVGVYIYHDKRSSTGFSIGTAYPRNDDQ